MKILMVSSYLPYPLFSGGHIRLYNLIKLLSKKHKITLVCEKRNYQKDQDIKEVKKFCEEVITFDRKTQWSFENIVKTGFSLFPFLITGHTNPAMKKILGELLGTGNFDLVHVETSYVMQNLPKTHVPIILAEHNIEYLVYKRFADNASLLLRPLLYADVFKLKLWEERVWNNAAKLVAVSELDRNVMGKIRKDIEIVSNGVDLEKFKVKSDPPASEFARRRSRAGKRKTENEEERILFIGEFKWMQNRDAIEFILKEIWPKLQSELIPTMNGTGIKLWVVGRNIPDSIRKLASDKDIIFDENAPKETELIYQKSDIVLSPIRVGGGTSYKILEGMASGIPVITTPLGNAIGAKENSEIVIANTSEDFVAGIKKLLEDKKFYETISANARRLVEEKYDWKKIVEDLEFVYNSVV